MVRQYRTRRSAGADQYRLACYPEQKRAYAYLRTQCQVAMVRNVTLISVGMFALATPSFSAVPAKADEFTRLSYEFTANGPTVILAGWTCWFADCEYAACHMTTLQMPALGVLRPSVRQGMIPSTAGKCAGKPVPVLTITYTPRHGAHGRDEVVLRSIADNGGRHVIVIHIVLP